MQRKFEAGQATGFDIERTRAGVVALRVEQEQLRRARGEATCTRCTRACSHYIDLRLCFGDGNLRSPIQQIEHCLPRQRGNVSLSNLQVLNAILYVAEHGCKWRGLPRVSAAGTRSTRMNRWSRNGVLDRVFTELQRAQIIRVRIEAVSLDSTIVKVHPDGTGALKNGPQAIGKSRGGWTTKIHMVAADARTAITFALSPGQAGDAPHGRALLERLGPPNRPLHLLMDKAYEGNETRQLALDLASFRSFLR